jgi:hypothetical protein
MSERPVHTQFLGATAAIILLFGSACPSSSERVTVAFRVSGLTGAAISDVRTLSGEANLLDDTGALSRFHDAVIADCGHEPIGVVVERARVDIPAGEGSRRVTQFEEVVSGPLTVAVAFDGELPFGDFGGIESPQGAGPLELALPEYGPFWDVRAILLGTGRLRVRAETHRTAQDEFSLDVRVEVELGGVVCEAHA